MKIFGLHILNKKQIEALKEGAKDFVVTEADKVVAALKNTHIGAVAIQAVHDLEDKDVPGLQKLESVVADVAPLIMEYAAGGGFSAVLSDAEAIARQLAQSVYDDIKKSDLGGIVKSLLKVLGL